MMPAKKPVRMIVPQAYLLVGPQNQFQSFFIIFFIIIDIPRRLSGQDTAHPSNYEVGRVADRCRYSFGKV
ncbi:MAG: hypothetical protein ACC631_07465, partial [Halocynthiibacter sp.]